MNARPLTREEWIARARAAPDAGYFDFPFFSEAYRDAAEPSHEPTAYGFDFGGGEAAFLAGVVIERKLPLLGPLRYFVSNILGAYGGIRPIRSAPPTPAQVGAVVGELLKLNFSLIELVEHFAGAGPREPYLTRGFTVEERETEVLNLAGVQDPESLYHDGCGRHVRRARSAGVEVARAGPEAMDEYYALCAAAFEKWGRPGRFSRAFLSALIEPGRQADLYVARCEGRIISGAIVLKGAREWIYWQGASSDAHLDLRPNNLLHHEIIREAVAAGIQRYNMGASDGLAGVRRFKRTFGATPRRYACYRWTDRKFRSVAALRRLLPG